MPRSISGLNSGRFVLAAAVLSATNFLSVFDGLVVTVALPRIGDDLGLGPLSAQWVLTSYLLPLGGLLLLGGRLGDRYGRRRVLMIGLSLFTLGLAASGTATSAWVMFTARALQGASAALAIPNTYAMISSMRSQGRRRRVFAAVAVAGSSGAATGAVVGGLVTQSLGWRWIFLLSVPIALAAVLATPHVLSPGDDHRKPPRLDGLAAVLSTAGLMMIIYSITSIERVGVTAPVTVVTFTVGVVLLSAMVVHEKETWAPLLRPALLKVRPLRASIAGMPGQVFAYQGTVYVGLLFFQQAMGYSPVRAGLAFAPLGIAAFVASPLATRLLRDRHWAYVAFGAQAVCATGLVLLSRAGPGSSYVVHILPGLVLLGLGIAVAAVTLNLAAGNEVSVEEKGAAYGLFETSTHVSGALVVAVLATVAASGTRASDAPSRADALSAGFQLAFAVAAGAALFAGVLTAVIGRRRPAPALAPAAG
jgi:EmrB/QacA subfamily drug resistance transporter